MIELTDKANPDKVVAYACGKCRYVAPSQERAKECCAPRFCKFCETELGKKDYTSYCRECSGKQEELRWQGILDKATKVDERDYTGPALYSERYDRYYDSDGTAEYLDDIENSGDEPEEYLFGCVSFGLSIDAESVIECATDEHHEDAYEQCDSASLQKLLDAWCAEQGITSYMPDYKIAVRVSVVK